MNEAPERLWINESTWFSEPLQTRYLTEYIRADVSAARIADLERRLAEAREVALEEAAFAGGDAAAEVLLLQEPDASPLKVQMTRQAIAKAIRNLKGPTP